MITLRREYLTLLLFSFGLVYQSLNSAIPFRKFFFINVLTNLALFELKLLQCAWLFSKKKNGRKCNPYVRFFFVNPYSRRHSWSLGLLQKYTHICFFTYMFLHEKMSYVNIVQVSLVVTEAWNFLLEKREGRHSILFLFLKMSYSTWRTFISYKIKYT